MSRSDPPRSPIVARLRRNSRDGGEAAGPRRTWRRKLGIRLAGSLRWLHIYLSMFGLASMLFFGVTGLTLNHPTWTLGEGERVERDEGKIDPKWLGDDSRGDDSGVLRLEIVEHLRSAYGVRGAMIEFRVDEAECSVTFKGPGYAADAFIDRASGRYDLTQTSHGAMAVLNDLHKGRDTGGPWAILIDISAVFMVVISVTGFALLFYLKMRRVPGLVVALVGTIAVAAVYYFAVP